MSLDALVSPNDFLCVVGQPFVWVHHETEEARVVWKRKMQTLFIAKIENLQNQSVFFHLFVTEQSLSSTVSTVTKLQTVVS